MNITYTSDNNFPNKVILKKEKEAYGPFRVGDPPRAGYNKTIGSNFKYIENPENDEVTHIKDVQKPIWRDPKSTTTTFWRP